MQSNVEFDPSRIDYAPLVAPADPDDIDRFRRSTIDAAFPYPDPRRLYRRSISSIAVAVLPLALIIACVIWMGDGIEQMANDRVANLVRLFLFVVSTLVAWRAVHVIRRDVDLVRYWPHWRRLAAFAEANALNFYALTGAPTMPGAVFRGGAESRVSDRFMSGTGRFIDFGNYIDRAGEYGWDTLRKWGYIALRLDRELPHIVLKARSNVGRGIPLVPNRDQVLTLEGEFKRYFTLYAPKDYERDALYVLSPDLMALLIDEASAFDVEIVDDWIIFYSPKHFDLRSPASFGRIMRIAQVVGTKSLRQTNRYADNRSEVEGVVANPGRRLRKTLSTHSVVALTAWTVVWAAPVINWLT